MKDFKLYSSMIAMSALLFTASCSKDDPGNEPVPKGGEMVSLSFTGALQQFSKAMATKQSEVEYPIPGCSEDQDPTSVTVAIQDGDGNWILDASPEDGAGDYWIEIPVIPVSVDSDGDGAQNHLTFEAEELELDAGTYSLEYFAVYNAGGDQIWLAPREDEEYGPANFENFVEDALPISIDLVAGTKHYVEVEVICYDEHFARQYGYLFFDFEEVPLTYLCLFANICDETGRHFPGNIHVKVWEFSNAVPAVYNSDNLLVDVENIAERNGDGEVVYAEPVCIPLPDRAEPTMVHMEVYSIDAAGNETLIETGDFTEEETKSLLEASTESNPEGLENYLHLRYGPYCGENSDPCLVNNPVEYSDDFDAPADFISITGSDYDYVAPSANALFPEGLYTFTDNPSNVHNNWVDETHDGNMFILNGDETNELPGAYFAITDNDVCPGDYYYVTFEIRNVLNVASGGENDVRLSTVINGIALTDIITVDESEGWKKIGLRLKANSSGDFDVEFTDDETAANGNDFALDNVIISNEQSIMTGLDQTIIQP